MLLEQKFLDLIKVLYKMNNKILILIFLIFSIATNSQNIGLKIGDIAPELKYNNPNGKKLKLSELRGKLVLIDFWASWCGPCRRENPNLVSSFKKYNKSKFKNGNGFEIYSLSLDKNGSSWIGAINKDELFWEYHVSDLGGWQSEGANIYGIRSIPSNVLINGEGIIIARDLKGPALSRFLESQKK